MLGWMEQVPQHRPPGRRLWVPEHQLQAQLREPEQPLGMVLARGPAAAQLPGALQLSGLLAPCALLQDCTAHKSCLGPP